jgi:hypothetical protein
MTTIKRDGDLYCVLDSDNCVLEAFESGADAEGYAAEFDAAPPATVGGRLDLAAKHHALFRHV